MKLPEIPKSYIILFLAAALIILRAFSIDTWVTAALGLIIGYLTGTHMEQVKTPAVPLILPVETVPPLKAKVKI